MLLLGRAYAGLCSGAGPAEVMSQHYPDSPTPFLNPTSLPHYLRLALSPIVALPN